MMRRMFMLPTTYDVRCTMYDALREVRGTTCDVRRLGSLRWTRHSGKYRTSYFEHRTERRTSNVALRTSSDLRLRRAFHQFRNGVERFFLSGDDEMYRFHKRNVYIRFMREVNGGFARRNAFGDLADVVQRFIERNPPAKSSTDAIISAKTANCGCEQIAHAAEAHKRARLRAERRAELANLVQPARKQCAFGIVAETEAVAHSRAERKNIFQSAAEFDADNIAACVNAKMAAHKSFAHPFARFRFFRCDDGGSRNAFRELYR